MFPLSLYGGPILFMVVILCLFASVKILREYERAVVFTLGQLSEASRARAWSC